MIYGPYSLFGIRIKFAKLQPRILFEVANQIAIRLVLPKEKNTLLQLNFITTVELRLLV